MDVMILRPDAVSLMYDIMKDHLKMTGEEHLIDEVLEDVRLDLLTTHTHLFYGMLGGRIVSYILFFELDGTFGDEIYLKQVHSIAHNTLHPVYQAVRQYAREIGAYRIWGESEVPHNLLVKALTGDSNFPSAHSRDKFLWDDLVSDFRTK